MIIIREKEVVEKLFAQGGNLIAGQINFFINELIKIIILGSQCRQDIPHWIDNALGAIEKSNSKIIRLQITKPRTAMFMGLLKSSSDKKINQVVKENLRVLNPEEYIQERVKDVYNQKERGNFKYRHLFNLNSIDYDDLFLKLKYIALCVSGQINPDITNYYDHLPEINLNKESKRDIKELLEKILTDQFYLL